MTKRVTVHEAKTKLSELLRRVESGEEIVIARGGTPVAVLSAFEGGSVRETRRAGLGSLEGKIAVPADTTLLGALSADELEAAFGSAGRLFT
jgi:antitoxin (DNA-binding transcriptional repressor) of toxin-antitoxin stability system